MVRIYLGFTLSARVPDALSIILKFCTNNKNSSGSPFIKQGHFKFIHVQRFDIGSLHSLMFTQYFFAFFSFLLLINDIRGGSNWTCAAPVRQIFLGVRFSLYFLIFINRQSLYKVSYTLS